MFNFKKAFTLGLAGAATALALNLAAPTKADAGTCWFLGDGATRVRGEYCHTQKRVNANGHTVWDVTDTKGRKMTLVFWEDNVVEIIGIHDRPIQRPFYTDRDGDIRIDLFRGAEFAIRL